MVRQRIDLDVLSKPEYYLYDTLPGTGETKFLIVDERMLEEAPFLDIRFEPTARGKFQVNTRQLISAVKRAPVERPPVHFIFHHAFVCSTLLARCLNRIDAYFSLKEPWILRRLADLKRNQQSNIAPRRWQQMVDTYLSLLAKPYAGGRATVIKATNVASNLYVDVAERHANRKVLYLYSDIESFLVSNLKKPRETQVKMPMLLSGFLQDSDFAVSHPEYSDPSRLSFLQVCAVIWVANIYHLKQVTQMSGFAGMRTLDMDELLSEPKSSLAKVSEHFDHRPTAAELEEMTHPDVLGSYAKDTRYKYDPAAKRREWDQVMSVHRKDIERTTAWANRLAEESALWLFLHEHRV